MLKKIKNNKILIIGAGPVGCTVAEILSKKSYKIKLLESRNHIGGNCYDYINDHGVLVHKYGPHYFRTNNLNVLKYLSKFTEWIPGKYFVNSFVDKNFYDFPINLNTINKFYNKNFNSKEAEKFLKKISKKEKFKKNNFQTYLISKIGRKLYEKFYKNYTIKQWGIRPTYINESVAKRIPIRFTKNKDYIEAKFKLMPKYGFTKMFNKMLSNKNIKYYLKRKYKFSETDLNKYSSIIFTGPIDAFFNFKHGKLGWRSLRFEFKSYRKKYYQQCVQVNYPNDYKFTRKVEYKHVTQQKSNFTTISKEYPRSSGDPYYPLSTKQDKQLYKIYEKEKILYEKKGVYFAGRLAEYKYINTDQAIEIGLSLAKKILTKKK